VDFNFVLFTNIGTTNFSIVLKSGTISCFVYTNNLFELNDPYFCEFDTFNFFAKLKIIPHY
jgi:hypothetical protein